MQAVKRPYAIAAAALAATSLVAATPQISRLAERPIRSMDTRLVDSSIFNIPFNLFQDIANVPYNEIQALNTLADSEFFTGNWFVVSATNLWGVDPGDPSHFMSVADFLFPFPALSGLGQPETDFSAGLGQQSGGWWRPSFRLTQRATPWTAYPRSRRRPLPALRRSTRSSGTRTY